MVSKNPPGSCFTRKGKGGTYITCLSGQKARDEARKAKRGAKSAPASAPKKKKIIRRSAPAEEAPKKKKIIRRKAPEPEAPKKKKIIKRTAPASGAASSGQTAKEYLRSLGKKVKDLTEEERRQYGKLRTRESRARARTRT